MVVVHSDRRLSMMVCMCPQQFQICRAAVLLGYRRLVVSFGEGASHHDMAEVFRCGGDLFQGLEVVEEEMCQVGEVFEEGKGRHNAVVGVFSLCRKAYRRNVVVVCSRGHDRHYCEAGAVHDGRCTRRSVHVAEVAGLAHWRKEVGRLFQEAFRMAVIYPGSHIRFEDLFQLDLRQAQVVVFYPLSVFVYRTRGSPPWLVSLLVLLVMVLCENTDAPTHQ